MALVFCSDTGSCFTPYHFSVHKTPTTKETLCIASGSEQCWPINLLHENPGRANKLEIAVYMYIAVYIHINIYICMDTDIYIDTCIYIYMRLKLTSVQELSNELRILVSCSGHFPIRLGYNRGIALSLIDVTCCNFLNLPPCYELQLSS